MGSCAGRATDGEVRMKSGLIQVGRCAQLSRWNPPNRQCRHKLPSGGALPGWDPGERLSTGQSHSSRKMPLKFGTE